MEGIIIKVQSERNLNLDVIGVFIIQRDSGTDVSFYIEYVSVY